MLPSRSRFLRAVEGPDADVWEMLKAEVFVPNRIHHAPINRTVEPDGARGHPIMAWGWFPTLGDLAKLARLLHHRGVRANEQILHAGKTAELFSTQGALPQGKQLRAWRAALPGFHYFPYRDKWTGGRADPSAVHVRLDR